MSALQLAKYDLETTEATITPTQAVPSITIVDCAQLEPKTVNATPIDGCVTLFRLGGEMFGMMHHLDELREVDGHLLGYSRESIDVGALITIGWETAGRAACRGVVAFCRKTADGYIVTINLDAMLAA